MSATPSSTTVTTVSASASTSVLPIPNTLWSPPTRERNIEDALNLGPANACFNPRESHPQLYAMERGQNYTIDRGQLLPDSSFLYNGSDIANVSLSGIVYVFQTKDGSAILGDGFKVSYGDQTYSPSAWQRPQENASCSLFTYSFPLVGSSLPSDAAQGPTPNLTFPQPENVNYSILITSANITFWPVAPPSPSDEASATGSSSKGPRASIIVPAVLIPLLVILLAIAVFILWRRRRREHMAPSAAFRARLPPAAARTTASPLPPLPPPKSPPRLYPGPTRMPSSSSAIRTSDDDLPDYTPALKQSMYRSMDQKRPILNLRQ